MLLLGIRLESRLADFGGLEEGWFATGGEYGSRLP